MWINTPEYQATGLPMHFSRTPGAVRFIPPHFAAHTDEILTEIGYTSDRIEQIESTCGLVRARSRLMAEA